MEDKILGFVFLVAGLFPIVASIANWNFFFENSKARFFVNTFGRNGARVFYIILGLIISTLGGLMAFEVL